MENNTKYKISVMQAYIDGKQIEVTNRHANPEWHPCIDEPDWDWYTYDYRVKPEPKKPTYRPYKNFAEFRSELEKHGGWAKDDRDCSYVMLHSFDYAIAKCLMVHFTWADDGTPCGIKVEE